MTTKNYESSAEPSDTQSKNLIHKCWSCSPGSYQFEISKCSEIDGLKLSTGQPGSSYKNVGTANCKSCDCIVIVYYDGVFSTFRKEDVIWADSAPTLVHQMSCSDRTTSYYYKDITLYYIEDNESIAWLRLGKPLTKNRRIISTKTRDGIKAAINAWLNQHPKEGYMYDTGLIGQLWKMVDNDVCDNASTHDN